MAGNIGELLVRIGADSKPLEREIRNAERAMTRASASFASWSSKLTTALTLPLAALGVVAIKTAGEMEQLRLAMRSTFESAGRSIDAADQELEALRKSAMAPGLDFPQAVKASIRLQGVGDSAEDARRTIEQVANAVTMTGGTAANLESVTVQMSQMISKGKVLSQDLRIIQENMPIISKLMMQAFGTSNADALQELGVTGKQFVEKITDEMAKLPRVQGGITNAIVNAWSAVQQSLVKIGETLNKTFNITGNLDKFATWIMGMADAFSSLDEGTQRLILGVAVFAAALGPLLKLMQGMVYVANLFHAVSLSLKKALIDSLSGNLPTLVQRWQALNFAMKASIIGATIAVVLALALAFRALQKDMSAQAQAARAVEQVNQQAANSVAMETSNVNILVATLKDENATRDDKKKALTALKSVNQQYFGGLDLEKMKVADLDTALKNYTDSLLRTAKARAALEQIVELEKKRNDLVNASEASVWQQLGSFLESGGNAAAFYSQNAQTLGDNFKENNQVIDAQIKALTELARANGGLEIATTNVTKNQTDFGSGLDGSIKKIKEIETEYDGAARRVRMWAQEMIQASDAAKIFNALKPIKPLQSAGSQVSSPTGEKTQSGNNIPPVESLKAAAEQTAAITAAMTKAQVAIQGVSTQFDGLSAIVANTSGGPLAQMSALIDGIQEKFGGLTGAIANVAGALLDAAASGASSFAELGAAALDAASKIAQALIVEIALKAALKAVDKGNIFGAIAAVAIAAITVTGLNALVKSVKPPKLAKGGITTGPTLAMVGDNPGGREAIVPLDRFPDLFSRKNDVNVTGTLRGKGAELLVVIENAQNNARRTRGR